MSTAHDHVARFPSAADIATFLGRDAHAFADDKDNWIGVV
jgi:hypothetical protein